MRSSVEHLEDAHNVGDERADKWMVSKGSERSIRDKHLPNRKSSTNTNQSPVSDSLLPQLNLSLCSLRPRLF